MNKVRLVAVVAGSVAFGLAAGASLRDRSAQAQTTPPPEFHYIVVDAQDPQHRLGTPERITEALNDGWKRGYRLHTMGLRFIVFERVK